MGMLDMLFGPQPEPEQSRPEPSALEMARVSAVADIVNDAIAARQASTTMTNALKLAAVQRGVTLLTSVGATFQPLVYRGGVPTAVQPRIVTKPNPYRTRVDHMAETLYGLVTDGSVLWVITSRDAAGNANAIVAVGKDDVNIDSYTAMGQPILDWNERKLVPADYRCIRINPRPGEFWGHSPLEEGLSHLAPIIAAEDYATGFFSSGGLPEIVLKTAAALTSTEAGLLKTQLIAARTNGTPEPMVLSGGVEPMFPAIDPQRAQMQESRAYGATVVARLLGIPAPLLQVETSGATVVYQNANAAVTELVKATINPMYLNPIEQAWSDLVPSTQTVRFDLAELERADIANRISMYAEAISNAIMTPEEARAYEGWSPIKTEAGHAFDPTPEVEPTSSAEVNIEEPA